MGNMTTPQRHAQSGIYYFRMAVPKLLVPIIGKTAFKASLKTNNLSEAKLRFAKHLANATKEIELAKLKLSGESNIVLNVKDTVIIAERWYEQAKDSVEQSGDFSRYLQYQHLDERGDLVGHSFGLSDTLTLSGSEIYNATKEQLAELSHELKDEITDQLDREGLVVPFSSDSFVRLARAFYPYVYRLESLCKARHRDDWGFKPVETNVASEKLSNCRDTVIHHEVKLVKNPLSAMLKQFVESESSRYKGSMSRLKTLNETTLKLELFISIFGDIDVTEVSRPQLVKYRDTLYQLPKSKKQSIRDKTIPEQIELAKLHDLPLLSNATVLNSLRKLSAFFSYAVEIGVIPLNPVFGVRANRKEIQREVEEDRGYSENDIQLLFQDEVFTNKDAHKTYGMACYWIPLFCRYTGVRLNEVAQLRKSDLNVSVDGFYYVNIRRGEGQSVKSDSSLRHIPIPKHLEELGFIDFVESTNTDSLFPDIPLGKYGSKATAFSKWWSRKVKSKGISTRQPSHAFRHSFKTVMRSLGVADTVSDAISGHAPKTEGDRYGTVTLSTKKKAIDQMPYLELKPL
jgi:integrase